MKRYADGKSFKKIPAKHAAIEVKTTSIIGSSGSQRPEVSRDTFASDPSPRVDSGNVGLPRLKEKRKGKQMKKGTEVLKSKEEYSHLLKSTKLTVFDWETTLVVRNIPPQIELVKKLIRKTLASVSIKKFCVIKKTFKSKVYVLLACVLEKKADIEEALAKLQNFNVNGFHMIVSRFVKPSGFLPGAFSVCIRNLSENATDTDLAAILSDCGVLNTIDVEFSETGAMTKVLVSAKDSSSVLELLEKNGTIVKSKVLQVVPVKRNTSIIVGNVHPKLSEKRLCSFFGEKVLHIQKNLNMMFQIFLEDEEAVADALRKDGESVQGVIISVRPWSNKNTKQYKAVIKLTAQYEGGLTTKQADTQDFLYEEMQKCGTLCCITPIKKNVIFVVSFETKDGLNAALQLNGQSIRGRTLEISKKGQKEDGNVRSNGTRKNHVFF